MDIPLILDLAINRSFDLHLKKIYRKSFEILPMFNNNMLFRAFFELE